ncbi:MAG: TolC family protein [Opitutales bacterium]
MSPLIPTLLLASLTGLLAAQDDLDPYGEPSTRSDALAFDLDAALRFALENNFAIARAREAIEEQHGLFIRARAEGRPEVNLIGSYSRVAANRLEEFGPGNLGAQNNWAINVEVRQTLYAGGRIQSTIESQKLLQEAALLEWRSIVHNELLRVRESFFEVQVSQARIAVEEEALKLLEEQLRDVQQRFDVGRAPRFDLLRARVAVANQKPALIRARNDMRVALVELREAVGLQTGRDGLRAAEKPLRILGEMTYQAGNFTLEEALRTARNQRIELDFLETVEGSQTENLKSQQAAFLPEVDLVAGYGVEQSSFAESLGDTIRGWTVGANVTWSIWAGGARDGRILEARSQLNQARLNTQEQRLIIDVEVRRAFSDWQEAEELVLASRQVVEEADEALRLAEARQRAGSATQLDLLEARVELTEARTNEVEALFSHNVALAQLLRAMGIADPFVAQPEVSFRVTPEETSSDETGLATP